mmetsp:Transcript_35176/g.105039  ORF Transcript_35176/g.105039 Transcript_35176/m.105039 type:complete len:315 (-) Transcript_35176:1533-2477(-)
MGLLNAKNDAIGTSLGLQYDTMHDYASLLKALQTIFDCAMKALQHLQCGTCDSNDGGTELGAYDSEVSHKECCCDVTYIKEITIETMKKLAKLVLLNTGAEQFVAIGMESLKTTFKCTIEKITRPYHHSNETTTTTTVSALNITTDGPITTTVMSITTNTPIATTAASSANCPCFSLLDIEEHHDSLWLNSCSEDGNGTHYINFDTPQKDDPEQRLQKAWGCCVGPDCLHNNTGVQSPDTYCYVGIVETYYFGFKWTAPIKIKLSDDEVDACFSIMKNFCEANQKEEGETLVGVSEGIDELSSPVFSLGGYDSP